MKRKRNATEYPPIQCVNQLIPDLEAPYLSNLVDCERYFLNVDKTKTIGMPELRRIHFAETVFVAADWAKYKQAYRITPELANDLLTMDDLSFPAGSLKMPFRTVYFDLAELHLPSTGAGLPASSGAFIEGVFMTYGLVPYGDGEMDFAGFVILTGVPETHELLYGGVFFPTTNADDGMTLGDLIDKNAQAPQIRQALKDVLLLVAYLSSVKPDVEENETQKRIYRPSRKLKTTAVQKWDVGIRYAKDVQRRQAEMHDSGTPHGTGKSPRPHIRKAHWHIYRIGPGRKEAKVLWLAPIEVNCSRKSIKPETPVVIRDVKKPKRQ